MKTCFPPGTVATIHVPATSANLGPGFDCLAVSLRLFNEITVQALPKDAAGSIAVSGEGARTLGSKDANLVVVAMERFAQAHDRGLPPVRLRMRNVIPLGRGLGSSAAAIAGGTMAAALLLNLPRDPDALLPVGLDMEGHPDNIVAALWGGFTLGVVDHGRAVVRRIEPPSGLAAVLLIPDLHSSTAESRASLPAMTRRADAVYNAGRVGLMVHALEQDRRDLLRVAMADRLHHPHRSTVFRYLYPAIEAALKAGAHGAALSGAGSSVIALASDRFQDVEAAFARVAAEYGVTARTCTVSLDAAGARCRLA